MHPSLQCCSKKNVFSIQKLSLSSNLLSESFGLSEGKGGSFSSVSSKETWEGRTGATRRRLLTPTLVLTH